LKVNAKEAFKMSRQKIKNLSKMKEISKLKNILLTLKIVMDVKDKNLKFKDLKRPLRY